MSGVSAKWQVTAVERLNLLTSHLTERPSLPGKLTKLSRSLVGKKAIVTGAASGMGLATAYLFADEGVQVAVIDVGQDRVDAVVNAINAVHPGRAQGWVCDVSDINRIKQVVKEVEASFGGIDILINNAGVSLGGGAFDTDESFEERWNKTMAINLTALAIFIRACMPAFQKSESARIINVASTEAVVSGPANAAYTATKAAVIGLTKSFAVELGKFNNITVNAILPGPIISNMTAKIPPSVKETYAKRRVPMRRYGDPEEVAQVTVSCCMPASSYLNGQAIAVDGGMTIRHT